MSNLEKKEAFRRLKGTYTCVDYRYPMVDLWSGCFKKGKKIIMYAVYFTYGQDECFDWGEGKQYHRLVRYEIGKNFIIDKEA